MSDFFYYHRPNHWWPAVVDEHGNYVLNSDGSVLTREVLCCSYKCANPECRKKGVNRGVNALRFITRETSRDESFFITVKKLRSAKAIDRFYDVLLKGLRKHGDAEALLVVERHTKGLLHGHLNVRAKLPRAVVEQVADAALLAVDPGLRSPWAKVHVKSDKPLPNKYLLKNAVGESLGTHLFLNKGRLFRRCTRGYFKTRFTASFKDCWRAEFARSAAFHKVREATKHKDPDFAERVSAKARTAADFEFYLKRWLVMTCEKIWAGTGSDRFKAHLVSSWCRRVARFCPFALVPLRL